MQNVIATILLSATSAFSLPQGLLSAVCFVESHHSAKAVHMDDGGSPSVGLCQIKISTARLMGFKGSQESLKRPEVNAYFSAKYLKYQLQRYNGDVRKAVAAYNAGTHRENAKGQTLNRKYVAKVLTAWAEGK